MGGTIKGKINTFVTKNNTKYRLITVTVVKTYGGIAKASDKGFL